MEAFKNSKTKKINQRRFIKVKTKEKVKLIVQSVSKRNVEKIFSEKITIPEEVKNCLINLTYTRF